MPFLQLPNGLRLVRNPETIPDASSAFQLAFQKYTDMILTSYSFPHLQQCHFDKRFSEDIRPEAHAIFFLHNIENPPPTVPNLLANGLGGAHSSASESSGYSSESSGDSLKTFASIGGETQRYTDAHFVMQAIRSFEESRLVQYDEASFGEFFRWAEDAEVPFKDNLPLKNPLRPKYSQMMRGEQQYNNYLSLDDDVPFFHHIVDEVHDPPSYWPPRLLHKSYYLDRVGLEIIDPETGNQYNSYDTVNQAANWVGLTPLVEEDIPEIHIAEPRQQ